jgi:hypothetical protein
VVTTSSSPSETQQQRRGAVPEAVLDGATGFVRDTPAELIPLIERIGEIDRAARG